MANVSIVIPLLNEAESLEPLVAELDAMAAQHGLTLTLILVDDGSTDGSWDVVRSLAARHPGLHGVRFRRNFGKAAALSAGFSVATDPLVVTLDADLQDNPAEIPKLLARLDEGFDVVSGWKEDRQDPLSKTLPSRVFNALVSWLTGVKLHDHNCGLKAYRREVLQEVRLYGELHRFVPVLAAARGFRVAETPVHHRARRFGKSKYGVSRLSKGFLDVLTVVFLTGYGDRPQHVLGTVGLGSFLLGGLGMAYLAARWVVSRLAPGWEDVHLHETAALYYALGLLLIGAQFLSVGLLAEMIAALLHRTGDTYSVAETTPSAPVPVGSPPQ